MMINKRTRLLLYYLKRLSLDSAFILMGILCAGLGLKGFLLPNHFLDGGVTGISLLLNRIFQFNLGLLILVVNLPFILLGYFAISKKFAVKTLLSIIGLVLVLQIIPYPAITSDKLLIAVFGGFFLGGGIGLAMRGGAVLDGTEILALSISRKTPLTIGRVIWLVNIIIFSCSAFLINIETALYAILTFLTASRTVDFIIQGIEEYTAITIISEKNDRIRRMILKELGRGVTIYQGKKGLNNEPTDIILTVATRLEVPRLLTEIKKIDHTAFIMQQTINDIKGGMIKKRPLH